MSKNVSREQSLEFIEKFAQNFPFTNLSSDDVQEFIKNPKKFCALFANIINPKINAYLRLISVGETITIPACKGGEKANIYHAKKTFPGDIDYNFDDYGINLPQPPAGN